MADTHIKIKPVTPRVQYTANGSTTVFPYSFAIFDETDMVVYVDDDIITAGYTVSGAGQTDGGNVTFDSAPEDGKKITLLRNVPIERITDFQEGGTFRPKNINDEFDRQTAFAQQVQEKVDRTLILPPTTDIDPSQILGEVERIYDSIDNVDAVADDISNVNAVAGNQTNIDAVAGNESNINIVAGISSDVSTVAENTTDISNVATNMSDVNDCATNMGAIQAAPSAASSAEASAEQAAISAAGTHFKLFHHDWFDYELNDMAWLRADTFSWQNGTVYTDAYQHLVKDLESSKKIFYGWISSNPLDLSNYYTLSATPSVGDAIYSVENNTSADTLTTIASISGTTIVGSNGISYFSNAPETRELYLLSKDTIGAFDVYYYLASDGHKIVAALNEEDVSDVYDEFGVAWYYILDTTNQRFKLPRENPAREELIQVIRAKGNGKTLGLTNGTDNFGLVSGVYNSSGNYALGQSTASYGQNVGGSGATQVSTDIWSGITTDSTESGIISDMTDSTSVYKGKQYLYFYIGQFSQSATEQTAGLNSELFNGKMDLDAGNATSATVSGLVSKTDSTSKATIVGWGSPDYSTKVNCNSYTSGSNQFEAPSDGFIYGATQGAATLYINDSVVKTYNALGYPGYPFFYRLSKGDKFYGTYLTDCNFSPAKGV